jgi:hypothetical protein
LQVSKSSGRDLNFWQGAAILCPTFHEKELPIIAASIVEYLFLLLPDHAVDDSF